MIVELIKLYPKASVILISIVVSFFMVFVYKYTTNQSRMKEVKEMQKKYQKEFQKFREMKDHKKMMEVQKKMMEVSMEMMKSSLIPMTITMLPLFVLIIWLRNVYTLTDIAKTWIWYYIGFGLISNSLLRKLLKVY